MQLWLSLKTLQKTSGLGGQISNINDIYFIRTIKGIMSRISWFNAIYSDSILLKEISIYNLLHHNTGHPVYMITYLIRDMKISALSASDWN